MAKKKFINQLYRKNKSSMVTSKMLQEQSVNAILADSENRTLWINGSPYGNAYVKPDTNNDYDRLDSSNKEAYGPIHAEIFNDFDANTAEGDYSHAEGKGTQTYNEGEHAEGKYNYSVDEQYQEFGEDEDGKSKGTISTVGIGTNDSNRKNAMRIDNNGAVYITGIQKTLVDGRNVYYDPCNYEGKNLEKETKSLQEVIQGLGTMQEVTYGELRSLIDNGQLIPGMQYRITDYASNTDTITETYKDTYKFAANQFDIIVVADSENTLNKNARACHHDFDKDIRYKAENIINANPYINDENNEDDNFNYISYENYLVYKTLTNTEKQNYSEQARKIYDKTIKSTEEIERKKSYFDNTDIESWKLQYNYNNENSWQNTNSENQKILVNVEVKSGEYQLREYIYETEIEDTVINNINYKYKWRLYRYQKSNINSYDFDTINPITNVNIYKTKDGTEIYNIDYDNILLTQLLYPSKENPGELFFGLDNQLYCINNYNDSNAGNIKSYLTNDIVLLNIEYINETRNFLYNGETYYNGEKVYKWYEIDYINNKNNIIGLENLNENTFNTSNCNIKIKEDTEGQYKTFILSKSLTPLKEYENNDQEYITGENKNENELSFVKDMYFKEYLEGANPITNNLDYKVGYCDKSPNISLYDLINIFQKNNSTDIDFNIHYNLTDEVYEHNNNGTYEYYSVWCISDPIYAFKNAKILVGDINTDNYDPYKTQSQVIDFINSLKSKTYYENIDYGNYIIDKLTFALKDKKWYSYNIDEETKFYTISNDYSINTLVFNSIIFKYDTNNTSNIEVNRILANKNGLIYNFKLFTDNNLSIPQNDTKFILFKNFYNKYKENFIENTELKLYFSENDYNTNNFNIYSDLDNNVYIYYTYSSNNILSYNNFKFINKYYKSQGIINYLCDEFNNECYYDFKNIKFKVDLPWYSSDSDMYKVKIKIQNDKIKVIDSNNTELLSEDIGNLSNSIAETNTNGEIFDFYYFYTFSSLGTNKILDNSLNNNTNNNSILNNSDILVKNIFINCEVNNNKIINSENIILYMSKFCNNIINNCTYSSSNFNIFNMLIYYGNATGGSAGSFDIPWGREAVGNVNFENNIINNSSNIQFLPNIDLLQYDVLNNKLYNYNNLQFNDTLNSAVLFNNYTGSFTKKISDKENTVIDIPNIKTYKNADTNILNISHDNIDISSSNNTNILSSNDTNISSFNSTNISSSNNTNILSSIDTNISSFNSTNISSTNDTNILSTNDTNISSSNTSNIIASKYVFLHGNENISNTVTGRSSINSDYNKTSTSNNDIEYKNGTQVNSRIAQLSSSNFNNFYRKDLYFQYSYDPNNTSGAGQQYIGVGDPLKYVQNNDDDNIDAYWVKNPNDTPQKSLYYPGTDLIIPSGFEKPISYPETTFASFSIDANDKNKGEMTDGDVKLTYLLTTIKSIAFNDTYIDDLINIYPSFWFLITGYIKTKQFDINFIFNCKYFLTYDITYGVKSPNSNTKQTHSGDINILEGIVNSFSNTGNVISTDNRKDNRYFGILCLNSLKIISDTEKSLLNKNINDIIIEINNKIKNYNNVENGYVESVKLGIKVTFDNIGGATVLGRTQCSYFIIKPLNAINSVYVKSNPDPDHNITTKRYNSTEIYKCMWNIQNNDKLKNWVVEYSGQMHDSLEDIFQSWDYAVGASEWGEAYDKIESAASNKPISLTNINNMFTVTKYDKYKKNYIPSKPEYNENNGVYVQLCNDTTVLSVKQMFNSNLLKYINLGFNKYGYPVISFNDADNKNKDIDLNKLYNLLNP